MTIKSPDEIYCYERNLQENRDQFISYAEWLEIRYNEMLEALIDMLIGIEPKQLVFKIIYEEELKVIEKAAGMSWEQIKATK